MADNTSDGPQNGPWGNSPTLGDFASATLDKARAFLQARNADAAIREAEAVFSQDPNGRWGYAALDVIGDAHQAKGCSASVVKIGRELLLIDPERQEGYIHLARGALDQDDMRACIQAIERGLDRHPHSLALTILNSVRFRQSHDYKRAVEWGEKAVELAPWHPGTLKTLAFALHAAERFDDARRLFDEARALDPAAAHSFHTDAIVAFSENRFRDAAADALKALELDPQDDDCRRVLFRSRIFANPLLKPYWAVLRLTKGKALGWAAALFAAMIVLTPMGLGRFVFPAVAIYYLSCMFVVLLVQMIDDRRRPQKPPTLKNY